MPLSYLAATRGTTDPQATATSSQLYADWKVWAEAAGEYIGKQTRLTQNLVQRGYQKWQHPATRARGFSGIAPLNDLGNSGLENLEKTVVRGWSEEF